MEEKSLVYWLVTAAAAAMSAAWGSLDTWLKVLCLLSMLDALAGLSTHLAKGTMSRDNFIAGVHKKIVMLILVTASVIVQVYVSHEIGIQVPLTLAAAGFYGAREFLSIMKHAAAAGLGVPSILLEAGERMEKFAGGGSTSRSSGGESR